MVEAEKVDAEKVEAEKVAKKVVKKAAEEAASSSQLHPRIFIALGLSFSQAQHVAAKFSEYGVS